MLMDFLYIYISTNIFVFGCLCPAECYSYIYVLCLPSRGDPCCYVNYTKLLNNVLCSGNKIICEKSHGRCKGHGICGSICG